MQNNIYIKQITDISIEMIKLILELFIYLIINLYLNVRGAVSTFYTTDHFIVGHRILP